MSKVCKEVEGQLETGVSEKKTSVQFKFIQTRDEPNQTSSDHLKLIETVINVIYRIELKTKKPSFSE